MLRNIEGKFLNFSILRYENSEQEKNQRHENKVDRR